MKLSICDIEEELSEENMHRFYMGLYAEDLNEEGTTLLEKNISIMKDIAIQLPKLEKGDLKKSTVVELAGMVGVLDNVLLKPRKCVSPFLGEIMQVRDNINKFLSKYKIDISEEDLGEEVPEGLKTTDEMYDYYAKKAIERIEKEFGEGGKTDFLRSETDTSTLEGKAQASVKEHYYSHGHVKIVPPYDEKVEEYMGIKEGHDKIMKMKEAKQAELSESYEKDKELTLNEYLGQVADVMVLSQKQLEEKIKKGEKISLTKGKDSKKKVVLYTQTE